MSAYLSRQITKARGQPLLHRGGVGIVVGEGVRVDVDGIGVNGHARRLDERDAILHCAVDRGGLSEEGLGVACVHVRRIGGLCVDPIPPRAVRSIKISAPVSLCLTAEGQIAFEPWK